MLSGPVTVSTGELESVAFTCTVEVPAVVGVPLTTQPADKAKSGWQRASHLAAGVGCCSARHANGGAIRNADRRAG